MATKKLSMQCPEVNGFMAALEEALFEGEITKKAAQKALRDFRREHLSADICLCCQPERNR